MRCPSCGVETPPASAGSATRCLDCGALVAAGTPEPAAADASPGGEYRTPFGRFLTQVQADGRLAGGYRFADPGDAGGKLDTLLGNLGPALKKAAGSGLAELRSYDPKKRQCVWVIPGRKGGTPSPLAAAKLPLKPEVVRGVALKVGAALRRLHRVGLAAYDLDPHLVFADGPTVTLVPTPWLASLTRWGVGTTGEMPYVAPELAGEEPADPARADLYALGTLVMRLLTGADPADFEGRLPSEGSAKLAAWDAFVDGCRRTHPGRRFESVGQAMKAVPGERKGKLRPAPGTAAPRPAAAPPSGDGLGEVTIDTSRPPRRKKGKLTRRAALAGGAAALAGTAYWYRNRIGDRIGEIVPAAAGVISDYRRGFGDSVLQYADRGYDGVKWELLKEADALTAAISSRHSDPISLSGWDDDNFWVLYESGAVMRLRGGDWEVAATLEAKGISGNFTDVRLLAEDSAVCTGKESTHRFTPAGSVEDVTDYYEWHMRVVPVSQDMYYVVNGDVCFKVEAGRVEKLDRQRHKERLIFREDNTPLREYDLAELDCHQTLESGRVFGIVREAFEPNIYVERRSGRWFKLFDCKIERPQALWCLPGDESVLAVVVGKGGVVVRQTGEVGIEQQVTTSEEATSADLVSVWGTSPEKYWVMDKNGTVWERQDNRWRTVVRGLYIDDVEFTDTWVSPTGTVFAVNDDGVWKLG